MKTREEIEQLADKYSSLGMNAGLTHREYTLERIAYCRGYEQCQEDMADKKYTEEDIRKAILMARVRIENVSPKYSIDEIFLSLQPKTE